MQFLAITQHTATWLLAHPDVEESISKTIGDVANNNALRQGVFVAGPLRLSATSDGRAIALWNIDYLGSAGTEAWGFLRLDGPYGAVAAKRVPDMLRSALTVFDVRLQNLLLPANLKVRTHGEGMFTALLGRGNIKKHSSFGYLDIQASDSRSIFVVGPADEEGNLDRSLARLVESLRELVPSAESLVLEVDQLPLVSRGRPAIEVPALLNLRESQNTGDGETPVIAATPSLSQVYMEPLLPLTYDEWIESNSPLASEKRQILVSDLIESQPIRIVGPAGSGKSLLMQLMAVRAAKRSHNTNSDVRILYLVHNSAMMKATTERFETLWPENQRPAESNIEVLTLQAYCRNKLRIDNVNLLDEDASETKMFQRETVKTALQGRLKGIDSEKCPTLFLAKENNDLLEVISGFVVHEIGIVIKGYRQFEDRRRYVSLERPLSRFHRILSQEERGIVFDAYQDYHREVFEEGGYLDSDDLALDLLSQLRTQLWQLKRRIDGYDYLFVDETQLYNENERRLFPYLTKKSTGNLPIAISIDEAQSVENASTAGFAMLGLSSMRNETLHSVFRSTESILRLAFHLIQRTTDLFGPDFPNYTELSRSVISDSHAKACMPKIHHTKVGKQLASVIAELAKQLRAKNLRQIGVIVMNDRLVSDIIRVLKTEKLDAVLIQHRGQALDPRKPLVAVASAQLVGGQEFDAVIIAGAESGVFPPPVSLDSLAVALEQEALRRLYLAFTRARYQVHIVLNPQARITKLLESAIQEGLIVE